MDNQEPQEEVQDEKVKTTVITSSLGMKVFNDLKEKKYFPNATNAFRFGVALAVQKNLDVNPSDKMIDKDGITWGTLTIDPDGLLRCLVQEIYSPGKELPQREAYQLVEFLADRAAKFLDEQLSSGMTLGQILVGE